MNGAKYREILDENLLQSTQDLRLGRPSNRTTPLSTQPSQSPNVLEWPCQSTIEHLWRDLKIAVHRHSQTILTELDRIFREEMGETPQIQVCQACSVISKKTQGCNGCQRFFNKVLSKGSEYLCDISVNILFIFCKKRII